MIPKCRNYITPKKAEPRTGNTTARTANAKKRINRASVQDDKEQAQRRTQSDYPAPIFIHITLHLFTISLCTFCQNIFDSLS